MRALARDRCWCCWSRCWRGCSTGCGSGRAAGAKSQTLQQQVRAAGARQRGPAAAQRRARGRSRGPQVGRGRGRGARAQRAGHDQAGRDVLPRGRTATAQRAAAPTHAGADADEEPRRTMIWAVVPAAGRGTRFGGDSAQAVPRRRRRAADRAYAAARCWRIRRSAARWSCWPPDDARWPGWTRDRRQAGAAPASAARERADSVLAGLAALPDDVRRRRFRAGARRRAPEPARRRPRHACSNCGRGDPVGAILAAPVRDTLKRAGDDGGIDAHRAARAPVARADAAAVPPPAAHARAAKRRATPASRSPTKRWRWSARAMRPLLVEGSEDNIKVTTPADLRARRIPAAPGARTHACRSTP